MFQLQAMATRICFQTHGVTSPSLFSIQHSMLLLQWFQPTPEVSTESENDNWSAYSHQGLEQNLLVPFLASDDDEDSGSDAGVDSSSSIFNSESKGGINLPDIMSKRWKQ